MERVWKASVDAIVEENGNSQALLLPCLHAIQKEENFIPPEAVNYLKEKLGVATAEIYGVITFYDMFTEKKLGGNVIRVCNSPSCHINDSKMIIETIYDELGIKDGETTADGKFTLEEVSCLGMCDISPAMTVNDDVFGDLSEEKVREIVKSR